MNNAPLNGAALDAVPRYAVVLLPPGSATMTFTLADRNLISMTGALSLNFGMAGQAIALVPLVANTPAVEIDLNVAGALTRVVYLSGAATMQFGTVGGTSMTGYLSGDTGVTCDAHSDLTATLMLAGNVVLSLTLGGDVNRAARISGSCNLVFSVLGDLACNAADEDESGRLFTRPASTTQFWRRT